MNNSESTCTTSRLKIFASREVRADKDVVFLWFRAKKYSIDKLYKLAFALKKERTHCLNSLEQHKLQTHNQLL